LDHLKEKQLAEERRRFLKHALPPEIALRRTAYDDQGKPPCDKDTRVEILKDITDWMADLSAASQNFFWLTGDPGCGKSAITASLARRYKDQNVLWAQYFINRNDAKTTDPRVYFPSIARQMSEHSSEHSSDQSVSKVIYNTLKDKPSLLDGMTTDQALLLFVEVVQVACDLDKSKPVAIFIDGLDETSRKSLEDTATIFSGLFKTLQRPNAKVFISSRTDDEITRPFYHSLRLNEDHVKHIHLDTSDPSSLEDVSTYLSRNIQRLVERWDLNWEIWPGKEGFETLCRRAAGLFIWAVTVVKFFEEQLKRSQDERLKEMLDVINEEGMDDVNKLYHTILVITYNSGYTKSTLDWEHEKFRWVVGLIVALKEPLSIGDIAALLDLRHTPASNPVNILHFVTNLRTVLVAGSDAITAETIPRLHKSFVDFITSDRADSQCRIDVPVTDGEIVKKCLRLAQRLGNSADRASLPTSIVRYAIKNWTRHLPNEGIISGVAIVGDDSEAFSKIISSAAGLRNGFMSASGDYQTHMYNPWIGLPPPIPPQFSHSSTIRGSDSGSIRGIAVSPDGQLITSASYEGTICIWDAQSRRRVGKRHTEYLESVCFSPDSRCLVSGSEDHSLRVWDCETGETIGSPLVGHTDYVKSVRADGRIIVSGSEDHTIRIWDWKTHNPVGSPIKAGESVLAVALSSNGHIAAGLANGHVCTWDVDTRDCSVMKGHTGFVWTVAFSPHDTRIASGSEDQTIRLWDAQTHQQIHVLQKYTSSIYSVVFSPDGQRIASGSGDATVRVWNFNTGQLINPPLKGHDRGVTCLTFSPDGHNIISGSADRTIRIWTTLESKQWPKLPQQVTAILLSQHSHLAIPSTISLDGNPSVISTCYSPDRTLYAASTLDGQISIWNTEQDLVWKSDASVYPIHLLRLSDSQLTVSGLDGSTSTWDLLDGKPAHPKPVTRGPQLLNKFTMSRFGIGSPTGSHPATDVLQFIPFDVDAGLWAYVDGSFVRFEGNDEESVTIISVRNLVSR